MGTAFSAVSNLLHNPQCLELSYLLSRNQKGLFLLGGIGAVVVILLETILVLAVLSCTVPELRRQGLGLFSGFFWRISLLCLCIKRGKTEAEILEEEHAEVAEKVEEGGGIDAYLQQQPPLDSLRHSPNGTRLVPGAPDFPPYHEEDESEEYEDESLAPTMTRRDAHPKPRMNRRDAEPSAFEASHFSTGVSDSFMQNHADVSKDELRRPDILLAESTIAPTRADRQIIANEETPSQLEVLEEYGADLHNEDQTGLISSFTVDHGYQQPDW